jgi:hypothetical protein
MANTGNTQQQINYGAAVNDGNGDPLRTAFIKTDDNFDNIWLAGPVGSNITITNNTVQVNNTNGNLILSPNGIGVIQTNSRVVPRLNNTYDLGSSTQKYRAGYFGIGGLTVDGNVNITGNLTAGNISYTSNVFVGDLEGSVFADDSTIMVDAIDNVLYAGRAAISGNVSATYFIGNGSQLTGLAATYGNANVVANLAALGSNPISTTGNVTANYFVGNGRQLTGVVSSYGNANVANYLPTFSGNISAGNVSATGNVTGAYIKGNGSELTNLPAPVVTQDITSNGAMSIMTYDGVIKYVNYATVEPSSGNISAGNLLTAGNVSGNYFIGNGSQLTGISTANTGNVTFSGEAVIGTGTSNTVSGLYLAPDPVSLTNDLYLRVRGNIQDEPTHIHFDTGNNQYYNQYIGDDNKYILLANTGNVVVNTNDSAGNTAQWTFNNFGTLTLPGGSRLSPLGANLDIFANGGYVNLITADESSRMGVSGAGGFITTPGGTWQFGTTGNLTAPGNVSAVGNILTGSQVIASGVIESGTGFSTGGYLSVDGSADLHNTTVTGNLSATGNVTAQNFTGNISITGNVQGTTANVTLVAGSYDWTFDNTGNLTLPGNTFAVNYADNTPVDVVTSFEDVWTVPTGNTTQSFTVTGNNSYQMWLEGNIPNGIIVWNATVTVTNTNVPVIGQQFAWNYEGGGNILMLNSIPAQIIGTAGAISNAEPAVGNTTNVFSFGINNASGNVANVRYGWIKIS